MSDNKPQYNPDNTNQSIDESHATLTDMYDLVAKQSLSTWDDDDLAIISMGMIPLNRLNEIVQTLTVDMANVACSGKTYGHWSLEDMIEKLNDIPKFKRDLEKEVSHALYRQAKMDV